MNKNNINEQKILELYNKYNNGGLVAKELNINNYQVYKILRKNGIEPKKVGGKEKCSLGKLIELHNQGFNTQEIANKVQLRSSSVWERLHNAGIIFDRIEELKKKIQKIPENKYPDIVKMYEENIFTDDIAKQYNVSKDTILAILKKCNVIIRNNYGKNNRSWKGGITSLHNKIRNCTKYIEWRTSIFQERNFTCEISGEVGGQLNAHHIVSFSEIFNNFLKANSQIIDENELFELAMNFSPFWNKTNIIVISEDIHKKIHSQEFRKSRDQKAIIVRKLAKLNWPKNKIYNFLDIDSETLNRILLENLDIKIITVSELQTLNLDKNTMQNLIDLGHSNCEIGKIMGVAHTTIKRYRNKYNI